MRYHVIFGDCNDYYLSSYRDISKVEGAIYRPDYLPGRPKLIKKMHTAHCLIPFSVNNKLPFRKMWYKQYFSETYRTGDEYVFTFFYSWYPIFENGYLAYLRRTYPKCKCVLFLCDINCARRLDMDKQKKLFDHIMVFERNFAKEHGIEYYPLVYSDYRSEITVEEKQIDLLFVGWAKGRYNLLKRIYDCLTEAGVNCQFYLTKMDEKVTEQSGIHIVDWVPYTQYQALLKRTKCLLDIIPEGTDCSTLRVSEAMSHKCKILTNNSRIKYEDFYDADSVSIYSSPENIDVSFLLKEYHAPDYGENVAKMGPAAFIRHLDEVLYQKGE